MSEESKSEQTPVEEKDEKAKSETPKTTPGKRHRPRRKRRHSAAPLLALLLLATLGGAGWWWQQTSDRLETQQSSLEDLRAQLKNNRQQSAQRLGALEKQLAEQQKAQRELRDSVSDLVKRNDYLRKDWLLGEAEYLLKLANYRLLLERDVATAIQAIQAADERLREVGDPALVPVRQVLAEDRNALKQVPLVDTAGLSLTLSALSKEIDKLPLKTPDPTTIQQSRPTGKQERRVDDWRQLAEAVWQDIKGLVIIRQHQEQVMPLMSPEERFYLQQNLRLQLEQARLALLLGKGDVFVERLVIAQQWLNRFFDQQADATRGANDILSQLVKQDVEPKLPDISSSYQALQHYLKGEPVKPAQTKQKTNETTADDKAAKPKNEPGAEKSGPQTEKKESVAL